MAPTFETAREGPAPVSGYLDQLSSLDHPTLETSRTSAAIASATAGGPRFDSAVSPTPRTYVYRFAARNSEVGQSPRERARCLGHRQRVCELPGRSLTPSTPASYSGRAQILARYADPGPPSTTTKSAATSTDTASTSSPPTSPASDAPQARIRPHRRMIQPARARGHTGWRVSTGFADWFSSSPHLLAPHATVERAPGPVDIRPNVDEASTLVCRRVLGSGRRVQRCAQHVPGVRGVGPLGLARPWGPRLSGPALMLYPALRCGRARTCASGRARAAPSPARRRRVLGLRRRLVPRLLPARRNERGGTPRRVRFSSTPRAVEGGREPVAAFVELALRDGDQRELPVLLTHQRVQAGLGSRSTDTSGSVARPRGSRG